MSPRNAPPPEPANFFNVKGAGNILAGATTLNGGASLGLRPAGAAHTETVSGVIGEGAMASSTTFVRANDVTATNSADTINNTANHSFGDSLEATTTGGNNLALVESGVGTFTLSARTPTRVARRSSVAR